MVAHPYQENNEESSSPEIHSSLLEDQKAQDLLRINVRVSL